MRIVYSSRFERSYRRLPLAIKQEAEEKVVIFRKNPRDHRLKTHKLKGKFVAFWSFSVNYSCRIVFKFSDKEIVFFYDVGDHDVYR